MDQPTVLILANDPEFARSVMARWQTERAVPAFTTVSRDVWNEAAAAPYDLAIIGTIEGEESQAIVTELDKTGRPVIVICGDSVSAQSIREATPRALVMRQYEGWLDALVLVAGEVLRRVDAQARARQAEHNAAAVQMNATLGRYMLEMRHGLNNALTSVLGNSELLLLEPGALSAPVREQVDVIRSMALRIHEILQRFSSLETELRFSQKAQDEGVKTIRVAAAS
ncbi:MAG TPA: histidine kinase dimerization/phospho-acceptor domain-containing protein [Terriglobales bacterium]|nr:histidine kinase dimerization/phospho-acceptor domain-containing protein [Terriglobales bacterium]